MSRKMKIGYLSLVKGSWVNDRLAKEREDAVTALKALDYEVVDCDQLVTSDTQADEACEKFRQAGIDVLVAHHLAFPLGAITPAIATRLQVPVILWSTPEQPFRNPPYRLEANSFCASNMTANHLWRVHIPFTFAYGELPQAIAEIKEQLKVFDQRRALRGFRVGSIGGRVPGFYTSTYNELALRDKFGIEVENITMFELVDLARSLKGKDLPEARAAVMDKCVQGDVTDEEIDLAVALYEAFCQLRKKYRLDAIAMRCWPEINDLYGIGVCHLLGVLTMHECVTACEGDVYGAIAMDMVERFSGEKPFFADLVIFDEKDDTGIFWHCGAAPACLCKPGCQPCIRKHPIIDGGGKKGVAVEFPLKAGEVTICRLGEERDGGFRLMMFRATAIDTPQCIRSTPLKVKFNRPARQLINDLVYNGFEHHYVVGYGDFAEKIRDFARVMNIPLYEF
ncbi:MAG: hypothetical protein IJJ26_04285 [Victivallales bacterium]|nr:hypothetical protein [Victivallales bacterium]